MQKILAGILLVVLLLPTHAFAQFKNPAMAAKNLANLDRAVNRATQKAVFGRPVVPVKPGVVPGNKVGLLRVKMPQILTPVNRSYATLLRNISAVAGPTPSYPTLESWAGVVAHEWAKNSQRIFYEDEGQLARDLNSFYQGEADTYIGGSMEVKMYMLPVDGILYKPAGQAKPVVLNSKEYFVIYDVKKQTGHIAKNIPEIYNLFQPKILPQDTPANKIEQRALRMQEVRASGRYKQAWEQFYRGDIKEGSLATALCKFYPLHPELLDMGMSQVVEKSTGRRFMVLEPVIAGQDMFLYSLDNTEQVGVKVDRAQLLNPDVYEVIE